MQLSYELEVDDLIAFQRLRAATAMKRPKAVASGIALVILVALAVMLSGVPVLSALLLAVAVVAISLWYSDWELRRKTRKLYGHGLLGSHSMELTETHLVVNGPGGDTRRLLEAIEKIELLGDYLIVHTGASQYHLVPRRSVAGDFGRFVDALVVAVRAKHPQA